MKRMGGLKRKTRHKLKKEKGRKGKINIKNLFQELKKGNKVVIKIEPSTSKGMPHPDFNGKIGIVHGKKGKNYIIFIKDKNKQKELIVNPIHLKKLR